MPEQDNLQVQTLSRKIAQFTVSFTLEAAPAKAIENAKLAILDCLGVAVLATAQEIGANLLNFANANASAGPCTVWGTSRTASVRDAALINGALAHGLDYDDRNHSTTYTLAASMALAESLDLSGAKMVEAFIVGREVRNSLDALFGQRSDGIGPGAKGLAFQRHPRTDRSSLLCKPCAAGDLHGWEAVAEKFNDSTAGILAEPDAKKVINRVNGLEKIPSIRSLSSLLKS